MLDLSMRQCRSSKARRAVVALGGLGGLFAAAIAHAEIQQLQKLDEPAAIEQGRDLYLEVFIDNDPTEWIAHFRETQEGLSIDPQELENVGIAVPPEALGADGQALIERLPDVSYHVDEPTQSIYFEAGIEARATRTIDAAQLEFDPDAPPPQSGFGGVLNYTLFANSGNVMDSEFDYFGGLSIGLDARVFSPLGTLSQSATASTTDGEFEGFTRLDTTWTYSDPKPLLTYRAGDFVSGGLTWTRPVRFGGLQVQRNFALRPDLVTAPLPAFGGTAAVPSTLEIYQQNAQTYSGSVPAGPFQVTNLPIYSGAGTVDVVLRDTLGRETRTTVPFYVSDRLLQHGLWDFSAEIGFPRRNFGIESSDYDRRIMGSGSVRYGLADNLTLEGHFEGDGDLINGGVGAVFSLGPYGVVSLAGAASHYQGETGGLVNATVELGYERYSVFGRIQRTFGVYEDIASVTADTTLPIDLDLAFTSIRVPKTLAQVAVSAPILNSSSLNLSYTYSEREEGDRSQVVGLSYSQPFLENGSLYASAFADLDDRDSFGVFAGVSIPLDGDISVSTGIDSGPEGTSLVADAVKSERLEPGSVGWRVRTSEGEVTNRAAAASYRSPIARFEGGVQQVEDDVRVTGQVDGAIVAAGGGVFLSNRVDDAFAVVETGVPDVEVFFQNRSVGTTGRSGRILIPDLNSYERNEVSIDPANLPVDADIPSTREIVVPADRSGVVVDFGIRETAAAARISFVDAAGEHIPVGSTGQLAATGESFFVGYDGEAYIQGLATENSVSISRTDGSTCSASFTYHPSPGSQVTIGGVVCQ